MKTKPSPAQRIDALLVDAEPFINGPSAHAKGTFRPIIVGTVVLAKELCEPITFTIHLPRHILDGARKEARKVGLTLDEFYNVLLAGNWSADVCDSGVEVLLHDLRDEHETEQDAPRPYVPPALRPLPANLKECFA